ncbi:MAG: hypothetical protein NT137_03460 [Methanomassiliicoccales archaeon]|nr:hypothetical protein [Methanomassiliicoccales archaeon]
MDLIPTGLEPVPFTRSLELEDGIGVMDPVGLSEPLQALVIAATIEGVRRSMRDPVLVVLKAWKSVP